LICNTRLEEERIMDFSIGGIVDAASDFASDALNLVESAGDLAGEVAPLVGLVNPAAGAGLATFAAGTDLVEKFVQEQVANQGADNIRDHRECGTHGGGGGGGGCEGGGGVGGGGGGGSVFEQLALAMGEAMDKKLQELLDAAEDISSADSGDILSQSAKITALSKELEFISQATNSSINGLGTAAKTAAQKA
jgi:hypothetical protein